MRVALVILLVAAAAAAPQGDRRALSQRVQPSSAAKAAAFPVVIHVDAARKKGEMRSLSGAARNE